MKISRLDTQFVIVSDVARSERFYHETFDLPTVKNTNTPTEYVMLRAGHQLLILTTATVASDYGIKNAAAGSCMVNLVTKDEPTQVFNHLQSYYVTIEHNWQSAIGAEGACKQLALRDPDDNLIILTSYK